MDEENYVQRMFEKHFCTEENKIPTLLYGLGKQTEYVLRHFPDYPVMGVLDGYKHSGIFCGKPILDLEMVVGVKPQIIILAREASKRIIFRRIKSFCRENEIKVFDLEGKLLSEDKREIVSRDHFQNEGKYVVRDAFQLGFSFLGPVVTGFAVWLEKQLKESDIHKMLFISRDGYLFQKVFDLLKNGVETIYFLMSRTSGSLAGIETEEDIRYLAQIPFAGSLSELLEKRFHIDRQNQQYELAAVDDILEYYSDLIMENARRERRNYQEYIKKMGIGQEEHIALFDFVSTGTCQMNLEVLLGRAIKGFYFERIAEDYHRKKKLEITDFLGAQGGKSGTYNYFWLEILIKETVPSIYKMTEGGIPVYGESRISKAQKEYVEEVQRAAVQYAREHLGDKGCQTKVEEILPVAIKVLEFMDEKNLSIESPDLKNIDEFMGREITGIV